MAHRHQTEKSDGTHSKDASVCQNHISVHQHDDSIML